MREAIRQPTFGGAMGVLDASSRLKLSLFFSASPALGSADPAGPSGLGAVGGPCPSTLWPIRADSSRWRPLSLYPLADKGLGPVGGPYRSTLWPFRRLATYPSYPYRVVPPCPRTLSKFSGLATYPLGLGEVRALEAYIFSRKSQHEGVPTSFLPNNPNFLRPEPKKNHFL